MSFSGESGFPAPPPPPGNFTPPPGYVSYGGNNNGAFGNFRPVGGLGKAIRVLLIILIPILAIAAFLLTSVKSKADDYVNGSGSLSAYEDALGPYGLLSLLSGVLTLSLFVLTILWMFRMAKNQIAMNRNGTWGPAWAIAGWFLPPCILYVIPYLMMRDLWKASDPNSGPDWKKNPIGPIVHIWWVLWGLVPIAFIGVTVGNFKFNANADNAETAKDIVDGFTVTIASSVVQFGAAIAFLLLVTQLTARHKQTTNEG
ncbi:MAG: DUF4328 domain-containing protein [Ilumatobacteraceae bacterium]